ncbi:MAG: U32 family peptidase [Ruminococcus sp.]|nr:U32 family peptidase [Ruminococcus sp.]
MNRPEILAPAGARESLLAALRCGADAIYAGGVQFSARQSAENFEMEQLKEAVSLCHLYGAKFYLTMNTLIHDQELEKLVTFLQTVISIGVDAILVQDLGVLHLIRRLSPDIPIHASTQMTIHTPMGARWAKEHGIARVVVARELSRPEIKTMCDTDVEIEQFVHGALCMSVSGQCRLSAVIGSRSANRGRCAQACRLPFLANGKKDVCALSLKDLCLIPYAPQMAEGGVTSLKIEGRCKRPEYVAAAVTALKQALEDIEPDLDMLKAVFSRSGFTDGYYTGNRWDMFGMRRKEDVLQAKAVLPALKNLYQKPQPLISVDMTVTVCIDVPTTLSLFDEEGNHVTVIGAVPQVAQQHPTDVAQLNKQLGKLGGTIFSLRTLHANCDGVGVLSAAQLNTLRRDGIATLESARIARNTPHYTMQLFPLTRQSKFVPKQQDSLCYHVLLRRWTFIAEMLLLKENCAVVWIPIQEVSAVIPESLRKRVYLAMPQFCTDERKLHHTLELASILGFTHLVCENVVHIEMGKQFHMILHGGMGLGVTNHLALEFLRQERLVDSMLSPELNLKQIRDCIGLPTGVYAYGNLPVMICRNCPIQAEVGCVKCRHNLRDRTGRSFPVYCSKYSGTVTMYNDVPIWMADKIEEIDGTSYYLLDCTNNDDAIFIFRAYTQHLKTNASMTRGLFYRGVE